MAPVITKRQLLGGIGSVVFAGIPFSTPSNGAEMIQNYDVITHPLLKEFAQFAASLTDTDKQAFISAETVATKGWDHFLTQFEHWSTESRATFHRRDPLGWEEYTNPDVLPIIVQFKINNPAEFTHVGPAEKFSHLGTDRPIGKIKVGDKEYESFLTETLRTEVAKPANSGKLYELYMRVDDQTMVSLTFKVGEGIQDVPKNFVDIRVLKRADVAIQASIERMENRLRAPDLSESARQNWSARLPDYRAAHAREASRLVP